MTIVILWGRHLWVVFLGELIKQIFFWQSEAASDGSPFVGVSRGDLSNLRKIKGDKY